MSNLDGNLEQHLGDVYPYGVRLEFEEEVLKFLKSMKIVRDNNLNLEGAFIDDSFQVFERKDENEIKTIQKYVYKDNIFEYPTFDVKKLLKVDRLEEAIKKEYNLS